MYLLKNYARDLIVSNPTYSSIHIIHRNDLGFLNDMEYTKLISKKVIFIRHANSLCNSYKGTVSQRRVDKSLLDSPLTELGKTEALQLKEELWDSNKIDLVVSSSLSRAMETAGLVFKDRTIKLLDILGETVGGWGDVGLGYEERLSRNSYLKTIQWDRSETSYGIGDRWERNKLWDLIDEGDILLARPYENLESTNKRIRLFWKWLANNTDGSNRIAVVTHSKLLGRPENDYGILLSRAKSINKEFRNCEMVETNFTK
jgi:broad specificity phosphatase PhoE